MHIEQTTYNGFKHKKAWQPFKSGNGTKGWFFDKVK
jgi:hypothetical protein